MERNKRALGFTLLEVLIALVILALAFSTSYLTISSTVRHLIDLQDKTAAGWVGLNVIANAQLGAITVPKNSGSINGSEKMFHSDWNWTLALFPTPDANVSQMTVKVSKSTRSSTTIEITGYLSNNPNSSATQPS